MTSLFRCILAAVLFRSIFTDLSEGGGDDAYKSRLGFCFLSMFYNTVVQIQTISMYFDNRMLYNHERGAKIYGLFSYWLAVWSVWFVFLLFHTAVFCIIAYPWSGFKRTAESFFRFYGFILVASPVTYFLAQTISATSHNAQTAMGIYFVDSFSSNCMILGTISNIFLVGVFKGLYSTIKEKLDTSKLDLIEQNVERLGFESPSLEDCFAVLLLFVAFFLSLLLCYSLAGLSWFILLFWEKIMTYNISVVALFDLCTSTTIRFKNYLCIYTSKIYCSFYIYIGSIVLFTTLGNSACLVVVLLE